MTKEQQAELDEMMCDFQTYQREKKEKMRKYITVTLEHLHLAVNDEDGQKFADACRDMYAILDEVEVWK